MFTDTRDDAARRAAAKTRDEVKRNIVSQGRVDSGRMLGSIEEQRLGAGEYVVKSDLEYTIYQEKGIGPVVPRSASVLVFKPKGSGAFVFAQRTKGFEGGKFFERASKRIRLRHFLP